MLAFCCSSSVFSHSRLARLSPITGDLGNSKRRLLDIGLKRFKSRAPVAGLDRHIDNLPALPPSMSDGDSAAIDAASVKAKGNVGPPPGEAEKHEQFWLMKAEPGLFRPFSRIPERVLTVLLPDSRMEKGASRPLSSVTTPDTLMY